MRIESSRVDVMACAYIYIVYQSYIIDTCQLALIIIVILDVSWCWNDFFGTQFVNNLVNRSIWGGSTIVWVTRMIFGLPVCLQCGDFSCLYDPTMLIYKPIKNRYIRYLPQAQQFSGVLVPTIQSDFVWRRPFRDGGDFVWGNPQSSPIGHG